MEKIITVDLLLPDFQNIEADDEERINERKKLIEQKAGLEEEIKDTEYINDENRDAEELTFSRALENLITMLRFLQLLCENHNLFLQKLLCSQIAADGRQKASSVNVVQHLAIMFFQYQKVLNSITLSFGHQLIDTIIECVQGPCKENQRALVNNKILDSSREFISDLGKRNELSYLGFRAPDPDVDTTEEDLMIFLDEFISKISTMLLSLLEGE